MLLRLCCWLDSHPRNDEKSRSAATDLTRTVLRCTARLVFSSIFFFFLFPSPLFPYPKEKRPVIESRHEVAISRRLCTILTVTLLSFFLLLRLDASRKGGYTSRADLLLDSTTGTTFGAPEVDRSAASWGLAEVLAFVD